LFYFKKIPTDVVKPIRFELNDKPIELMLDPQETLLSIIRSNSKVNLTGTKYGCGLGYCGSCTVLIDNEQARSCMILAEDIEGKKITTIEGLARNGKLHPVQKAFIEKDALQCGYCTPGMIMQAVGLLHQKPTPSRQEIIDGMEENLCRCGAHVRILDAIELAAKEMKSEVNYEE
jgi:carbon-monoxide dehydrogenase small subunit